jgi:uncharacterized protein (TIGR03790 family)
MTSPLPTAWRQPAGRRRWRALALVTALAALPHAGAAADPAPHPLADRVVIVAHGGDRHATRLANEYAQARGVPANNIVWLTLPVPISQSMSREAYTRDIHNKLLAELLARGLVTGVADPEPDAFGRMQVTVVQNKVRYLVLGYGIPLHIEETPGLDDSALRTAWFTDPEQAARFETGPLARNEGSVDGELSLLLKRNAPITGFVPNPLFRRPDEPPGHEILRVTRLDGPSSRDVQLMIENALAAERTGLRGRAYVDIDQRGGGFAEGNQWLRNVATIFQQLGFDTTVDEQATVFPISARFDQPVLYAGWYTEHVAGPFRLPDFRFPPGAIAVHLHSFSARNLRQADRQWCGPLIARGVTATVGNTAEPYLSLTHHLDALFGALALGANFGDAAYFALPGLGWQGVAFGDPLYQPFRVKLEDQLKTLGRGPDGLLLDPYVVLRQMNLDLAADNAERAYNTGRRQLMRLPNAALAFTVARMQAQAGDPAAARRSLEFVPMLRTPLAGEWFLFADIADFLLTIDAGDQALAVISNLIALPRLPHNVLSPLLKRGAAVANAANRPELAMEWTLREAQLQQK